MVGVPTPSPLADALATLGINYDMSIPLSAATAEDVTLIAKAVAVMTSLKERIPDIIYTRYADKLFSRIIFLGGPMPHPSESKMPPYRLRFRPDADTSKRITSGLFRRIRQGRGFAEWLDLYKELEKAGMVADGNINTDFYPPIFAIYQKGKYRVVVDATAINELLTKINQVLPDNQAMLHNMVGCIVFSLIDLRSCFWQTPMHTDYMRYLGFLSPVDNKPKRWAVTPFGLADLVILQQTWAMQTYASLQAYLHCVYQLLVDDNIFGTKPGDGAGPVDWGSEQGMEALDRHAQFILQWMDISVQHNRRINVEKLQLFVRQVDALGYTQDGTNIRATPKRISGLQSITPSTVMDIKSLRAFIGFANWVRGTVQDFSRKAAPLHDLVANYLRSKAPIKANWTPEASAAVEQIKHDILEATSLFLLDPSLPLYIRTDASDRAWGAVIFQYDAETGEVRPLCFTSGLFRGAQCFYTTQMKEYYAALCTIRLKRQWVLICPQTILQGDHLNNVRGAAPISDMVMRWKLEISFYGVHVQHIAGSSNVAADAISRILPPRTGREALVAAMTAVRDMVGSRKGKQSHSHKSQISDIILSIAEEQGKAPEEEREQWKGPAFDTVRVAQGIKLYQRQGKFVIPAGATTIKNELLHAAHDKCMHGGIGDTTTRLRTAGVWWVYLQRDVEEYVKSCTACQTVKMPKSPLNQGTMQLVAPGLPFSRVVADVIGPIGSKSLLLCVDAFTRYAELTVLDNFTSKATAKAFNSSILLRHPTPTIVHTDGGSHFQGEFDALLATHKIQHTVSTAHHHESVGVAERNSATILTKMRACAHYTLVADGYEDNLASYAEQAVFGYNTAVNRDLGISPLELLTGYKRDPAAAVAGTTAVPAMAPEQLEEMREALQLCAYYATNAAAVRTKRAFDGSHKALTLKVDDWALVFFPPAQGYNKLESCYVGPFIVLEKDGDNFYKVARLRGSADYEDPQWVHASRLRIFIKSRTTALAEARRLLEKDQQMVMGIHKHTFIHPTTGESLPDDGAYFHVRWDGIDEPTWEPRSSLLANAFYKAYIKDHIDEFTAQGKRRVRTIPKTK